MMFFKMSTYARSGRLGQGDVLVVWKLDRLGRSLHHLVKTVTMLSDSGIGLKVLTGQGAAIDTTTAAGRLSFGIFAALAEFESELIRERTMAGLQAARIQAAMAHRETIGLGTVQGTPDHARHPFTAMSIPQGNLRDHGKRVIGA